MDTYPHSSNSNLGWRLRTLRLRHNLTLVEVARLAGLDVSYLSRLERDALQNAKPKPDTVSRVLDALKSSLQEREAVYHIERPPLSQQEISAAIRAVSADLEESSEPYVVGDEHWFIHYYNRAARAVFGLTGEEYTRTIGSHMLHMIIDPSNPRYYRVPDKAREDAFRIRALMFQRNFAGEEFDDWYQRVVARIYDFPWAAAIWEHSEIDSAVLTIGRDDVDIVNPVVGTLNCRFELHSLVHSTRFFLASWAPLNEVTQAKAREALQHPDFNYNLSTATLLPTTAAEESEPLLSSDHMERSDFATG